MTLVEVKKRISEAERIGSRPIGSVRLIAVSKTMPADRILPVLKQNHRDFGENRVQEAARKWPDLRRLYPETRLHLLGPLQANKVRTAVSLFDAIHSLDRIRIAERIASVGTELGKCPELFVQINTGEESQKSGVLPRDADGIISRIRDLGLTVSGLMSLPPFGEEPALHFGLLAAIAKRNNVKGLSMGMSHDFETAVRLGSTHVRVGTAIFGRRNS